jgi:CRP-like cAMP-binding protein
MTPHEIATALGRCSLFSPLEPDELSGLLQKHYFPVSSYGKGSIVFLRGERYEELAVVVRGTLSAQMPGPSGQMMVVEMLPACQPLASAVLFSRENFLPVTVVAETAVKLVRITRRQLFSMGQSNQMFLESLFADMGDRVNFLAEKLRLTKFVRLEQKLAVHLLEQADRSGSNSFVLNRSKQQLADLFAVARPSVNRIFTKLANENIISFHGRETEILNPVELRALATEEN